MCLIEEYIKMSTKIENLSVKEVVKILECWNMSDYVNFVKENDINGDKLWVSV